MLVVHHHIKRTQFLLLKVEKVNCLVSLKLQQSMFKHTLTDIPLLELTVHAMCKSITFNPIPMILKSLQWNELLIYAVYVLKHGNIMKSVPAPVVASLLSFPSCLYFLFHSYCVSKSAHLLFAMVAHVISFASCMG